MGPASLRTPVAYARHATRDQLRLSGLGHGRRARRWQLAQEAERPRLPLGVDRGGLRHRRGHPADVAHGATPRRLNFGSAILQMPARTPAMTAMTAATLDLMSGGRFLLGLGLSGPQVVEGWHGQPYGKPLGKTREYVDIVRTILKREAPLEHHGAHYDIPYDGPDATGLGKPLKIIVHPRRADIPIYLAAIGPKNVELCAEIADGWLPIFFSPDALPRHVRRGDRRRLREGRRRQVARRLRRRADRHA